MTTRLRLLEEKDTRIAQLERLLEARDTRIAHLDLLFADKQQQSAELENLLEEEREEFRKTGQTRHARIVRLLGLIERLFHQKSMLQDQIASLQERMQL